MLFQLFRGVGVLRALPLGKGLLATGVMGAFLYFGRNLLVNGDESKIMLVIKCGMVGVVGCVIYLGVSLLLRQQIMSEFLHKLKK